MRSGTGQIHCISGLCILFEMRILFIFFNTDQRMLSVSLLQIRVYKREITGDNRDMWSLLVSRWETNPG